MGETTISVGAPGVSRRAPTFHEATIRGLSDRLAAAQRPIRILDAVRWDDGVERAFFAAGGRALPLVTQDYYTRRPLPFDASGKRAELRSLGRDVRRRLGPDSAAGRLLFRACEEHREAVDLLAARGTPAFGAISGRLYGKSSADAGGQTTADFGRSLAKTPLGTPTADDEPTLDAAAAAGLLSERLTAYFAGSATVRVRLCPQLASDASAARSCLKVRGDARFSIRQVRLLEAHEGWVHMGAAVNGLSQPVCTFLAKGSPSATTTQEGLAVLTEILAGASNSHRLRRLGRRAEATAMAEAGADFLDVYRYFLEAGEEPRESFRQAARVFRGGLARGGGVFTKDLGYVCGLGRITAFVRSAIIQRRPRLLPLLVCGKTRLEDLPDLERLAEEGLLAAPRFLPPPFVNLRSLAAFLSQDFLGTKPIADRLRKSPDRPSSQPRKAAI